MSRPHPFVDSTTAAMNRREMARAAVSRAKKRGVVVMNESAMELSIAGVIDEAELVRAGLRYHRGEGGTATVQLGKLNGGMSADVPEAHMNAAQDVFGASDIETLDKLRDVVRAVRAIDLPRERTLADAVRNFLSGWDMRGVYIDPRDDNESSLVTALRAALGEERYLRPAWGPAAEPALQAAE